MANLLNVQMRYCIGPFQIDVHFTVDKPWTILFGPSGSGKTTILRAIAGITDPDEGAIRTYLSGQRVLLDCAAGVNLPAHLRPVRTALQGGRLFPHLTVQQNLVFGRGYDGKPPERQHLADELLRLFRIEHLGPALPRQISGGEQQRACVARAVLSAVTSRPCLLLLDEPFTGLGASMRDVLLPDLRTRLASWKIPVVSVTHDIAEAFHLHAEVIKLEDGRVVAQGPVEEVLAEERARLLDRLGASSMPVQSTEPFLGG